MQKFMCYCTFFALPNLNLRRVFCVKSWGGGGGFIFGGAYFENFTLFILTFFVGKNVHASTRKVICDIINTLFLTL